MHSNNNHPTAPLYLCATYFALRELIQVLSFIHLGLFSVWARRGTNWLEIGLIVLILFWAVVLNNGVMPLSTFRTCVALTTFFCWLNFLNFLRGLLVELRTLETRYKEGGGGVTLVSVAAA